jgi:hypothetical protein
MPYSIKQYSFDQAEKLGVTIKPSGDPNKKIDVFKGDKLLARIGDSKYSDYPSYIQSHGKKYANERRRLYRLRHSKDLSVKDSPGFFARKILW